MTIYYKKLRIRKHENYREFFNDMLDIKPDDDLPYILSIPIINYIVVTFISIIMPIAYIFDYKVVYEKLKSRGKKWKKLTAYFNLKDGKIM